MLLLVPESNAAEFLSRCPAVGMAEEGLRPATWLGDGVKLTDGSTAYRAWCHWWNDEDRVWLMAYAGDLGIAIREDAPGLTSVEG